MNELFLFDVNGTIIEKNSNTDIAFTKAAEIFFRTNNPMSGIDNTAKSDKAVFIELLDKYSEKFTDIMWEKFLAVYRMELEACNPGIWQENKNSSGFIKLLHEKKTPLALLTGELFISAQIKLQSIDVWKYFPAGGFGEHGLTRKDIAVAALKSAENYYNKKFKKIWVIGDTPLDITTAQQISAHSVAVANSSEHKKKLADYKPDILITHFSEIMDKF